MSGPGLRLHKRTMLVNKAEVELRGWLIKWEERHDLTLIEAAKLLAEASANVLKYALRYERHPDDPDRKGDEE